MFVCTVGKLGNELRFLLMLPTPGLKNESLNSCSSKGICSMIGLEDGLDGLGDGARGGAISWESNIGWSLKRPEFSFSI